MCAYLIILSVCPTTARRLRPPPPCPSRSHGPSDPHANAATQNSMQQLAATTRLGVKKKIYPMNSLRLSEPKPNPNRLSDSYPARVHKIPY